MKHTSCADVRDGRQEGPICADCLQETAETLGRAVSIIRGQWVAEYRTIQQQITEIQQ